jgi:hypothetical protein
MLVGVVTAEAHAVEDVEYRSEDSQLAISPLIVVDEGGRGS